MRRHDHDVGHEDEEAARNRETPYNRLWNSDERIPCFFPEGRAAFKADETEDCDDDAETEARQRQRRRFELGVIDLETVLGESGQAEDHDQQHRCTFQEQHQHRRQLNILPGAEPGGPDTGAEEQGERHVNPGHLEQLVAEDREACDARHGYSEIRPD